MTTLASSTTHSKPSLALNSPIGRGPIMRSYRRRALSVWFTLALAGLMPALLNLSPSLKAAGIGLWFPGGGFLFTASPFIFVLTLVLFVISLVLWLLVGGFTFPLIVWGGSAIIAALSSSTSLWSWALWFVPLLAISVIAIFAFKEKKFEREAIPKAAELKAFLETVPYHEPEKEAIVGEPLSGKDLGALRHMLNLALQPMDEFEGFVTIDQFREAAWRYQLVSINYALAMVQTCRTPAFRGYLHEAQRRSIVKMKDRRVWKYWRFENFVGNLGLNPDPVIRDNIMYSGWWGLALGAYERATGDLQFSQTGGLTLEEKNGKKYVYDYTSMMKIIAQNFNDNKLCFFPCEPNWVFSICNLFGITGLLTHDKVHGTTMGLDILDQFNQINEEEFTTAEGRAAIVTSNRSGFVIATDVPGAFTASSQLLNMTSPRQAQAYWAMGMRQIKQRFGEDRTQWGLEPGVDAGNYKKNHATFWVSLMRGAKELGDQDIYQYAEQRYDECGIEEKDGAMIWQGSILSVATGHMARFATKDAWYRLAHGDVPAAISNGPILDQAPYPQVLVAGANNDEQSLDLVLCAGEEIGKQALKLDRLIAKQTYIITSSETSDNNATFVADDNGQASLLLMIGERTHITVSPK